MVFFGHTVTHNPQPLHRSLSMSIRPFNVCSPGQEKLNTQIMPEVSVSQAYFTPVFPHKKEPHATAFTGEDYWLTCWFFLCRLLDGLSV